MIAARSYFPNPPSLALSLFLSLSLPLPLFCTRGLRLLHSDRVALTALNGVELDAVNSDRPRADLALEDMEAEADNELHTGGGEVRRPHPRLWFQNVDFVFQMIFGRDVSSSKHSFFLFFLLLPFRQLLCLCSPASRIIVFFLPCVPLDIAHSTSFECTTVHLRPRQPPSS